MILDALLEELMFPSFEDSVKFVFRLFFAAVFGAALGAEREKGAHFAGLRTHMVVCVGATLFTLIPVMSKGTAADLAQLIKGVAAGVGFLGAGVILKLPAEKRIQGLTTAGSIWLTAAIGVAVGTGWFWPALFTTLLGFLILRADQYLRIENNHP